jgi:hypothetical protein
MRELLIKLRACQDALDWVGDKTLQEAWETCPRGDWMLWLYRRLYPDNVRELTLAKAHCAKTVWHLMKDDHSRKAVDMAIAYGEGRATLEELSIPASEAYLVAHSAHKQVNNLYFERPEAAFELYPHAVAASAAYAAVEPTAMSSAAAASAIPQHQQLTADICRQYLRIDL